MSKWININEAAVKYGYNKEVILFWGEMNKFPLSYGRHTHTIDEEGFQEFLRRSKDRITAEYIDTLEEVCIEKTRICDIYATIIDAQEKELQRQKEKAVQINNIQETIKRLNIRLRDCEKVFAQYEKPYPVCWIERLRSRLKNRFLVRLLPHLSLTRKSAGK